MLSKASRIFTLLTILSMCFIYTSCGSDKEETISLTYESEIVSGAFIRLSCPTVAKCKVEYQDGACYIVDEKTAEVSILLVPDNVVLCDYPMVSSTALSFSCDLDVELQLFGEENGEKLAVVAVPTPNGSYIISFFFYDGTEFCVLSNLFPEVSSIGSITFDGTDRIFVTYVDGECREYVIDKGVFGVRSV